MNGMKLLMGTLALCGSGVFAQVVNPFDPSRAAPVTVGASGTTVGATLSAEQMSKRGVLCGIDQSLDQARVCVDGAWMGLKAFEIHGSLQVCSLGAFSLAACSGKIYELGDVIPRWNAAAKKGKE